MIKAVIFDMGGVILRSAAPEKREVLAQRLGTTRTELERTVFFSPVSIQCELGQVTTQALWEFVTQHYGQPLAKMAEIKAEFLSADRIDTEMIAYFRALKPDHKLGLLSNAWTNTRQDVDNRDNFLDLFDVSIFSCEVGLRKPDARIFNLILEKLDVPAREAIFVDDFQDNITGAEAVGLNTVLFRGREAAIEQIDTIIKDNNH
jgi:epoxide hydrolase-like predicted phosphatase